MIGKVDKLVHAPADLSKLSDVVKNDVVKKDVYNAKVKNIEDKISDFTNVITNTTLNAKINEVKKNPIITNLATTTAFNAKINQVKNKIPSNTNLTTTTALTAVENSNLVKKLTITQKLVKMKIRLLLIMIMIIILLLKNVKM